MLAGGKGSAQPYASAPADRAPLRPCNVPHQVGRNALVYAVLHSTPPCTRAMTVATLHALVEEGVDPLHTDMVRGPWQAGTKPHQGSTALSLSHAPTRAQCRLALLP